ncbi:extracellular solute-binding protein [Streptomyces coeruleorubidus]|uniref:extracellular solute-binding protein n=1 Tax=Streptomyces coeruleorubidus TaxID=116188 RepID=UPI00237EF8D1|nr:extracellular solute-binding protein [Streptomyces coeruleorubidus]WDV56473.1 extracellular solute-binding protein [Streptomyces coeruleorubidus]
MSSRPRSPYLATACLLTAGALTLTACEGSSSGDEATDAAPGPSALAAAKGPVTVTLWHGFGGPAGEAFQKEIDAFNKANSGKIVVKSSFQGNYTDVIAKYTSAIRDGGTPSILVSNDTTTGYLRDVKQTVSAEAMAAANPKDLDLDRIRPAARNYYTADGELLAVPLNTSMPLLYVNDKLLDRAGVDRSTLGTLDGVAAAARKIHAEVPGVKGIDQPFDGWWFEQLTAAAGAPYCTPDNGREGDGATALSLTSGPQRKAIGTMAKLYTDGVALDTGAEGNNALSAFAAGKTAMMFNSSGAIGTLKETGMTGFTAVPYPLSGSRSAAGAVIGGAAMWVDQAGHSKAEQVASWKVISHLASAEAQERFAMASGYAPVNTGVDNSPTWKRFLAKNEPYAVLGKQFADTPATTATSGCLTGAMSGVRAVVVPELQQAFNGKTSLDTALKAAEKAGTAKIEDYREQAGQ